MGLGRRNRSWPEALKREIVAASFAPGSSVSMVARHYDVNANQVFGWRKRYRDEPRAPAGPVGSAIDPGDGYGGTGSRSSAQPSTVAATIEIDLAGKYRVRVGGGVDAASAAARARRAGAAMIPVPSGVRVWLAVGRTDMRRGMNGLALQVQEALRRDPHAGDLYVFQRRQRRPDQDSLA